jgi:6-phosphogluconate dehydrogenase
MQLGMIGLGRMGANLVRRLLAAGHEPVAFDRKPEMVSELVAEGAVGATTLAELAAKLRPPRAVWVMVPAAHAGEVIADVATHLQPGDTIIDGGNSFYRDDVARAEALAALGLHFVDIGTSGGVYGLMRGFCLMIGGEDEVVADLAPLFDALAPGLEGATRTPGRVGPSSSAERGWLHCGPHGAGHFVKMVHNGIEYGLMAAYAEGFNVLRHAADGLEDRAADAETAPLRDPQFYRYDLDIPAIAEVWRRGSVIASWLLDLGATALVSDPKLERYTGRVSDSGEGRWTVQAAVDEGVPVPVLATALFERFSSQGRQDFADRILSALREQFGGHLEMPTDGGVR